MAAHISVLRGGFDVSLSPLQRNVEIGGNQLRLARCILATAVSVVLIAGSPAGAGIKIKRVQFNPSGPDSGANWHLNREYVYLVNTGSRGVQLQDWRVVDRGWDHVYRFPALYLSPGETIHLRSGKGDDGAPICEAGEPCKPELHYDIYWDLNEYVWNNGGDRVRLIHSNGKIVDRCAYVASSDSPVAC